MLSTDPIADSQSRTAAELQTAELAQSSCFPINFKGCEYFKTLISGLLYPSTMANQQLSSSRPWFLELVPFVVILLIAAHVLALVYWIYRLAIEKEKEKQPQRRKAH